MSFDGIMTRNFPVVPFPLDGVITYTVATSMSKSASRMRGVSPVLSWGKTP